jgi:hypothetical protein
MNIDCSKSFIDTNRENGIEYLNEFFCKDTQLQYKARLITSTNVFQHTEDIRSFVQGIERNLSSDGVWCLEFPYIFTTLMNDNYDQVYHEHVYYYCLRNIKDLLEQEGLRIINVSYHNMHAGTLRVLDVKENSWRLPDCTIFSFLNLEKSLTEEYCIKWGIRAQEKIKEFKNFIFDLLDKGKTITGFGAAAKGCVFLNSCGFNDSMMQFIIDDTVFKQGKYIPGTGIEVASRNLLDDFHTDYMLILAHNFKDYIITSLINQYQGKFIVMFPEIRVL